MCGHGAVEKLDQAGRVEGTESRGMAACTRTECIATEYNRQHPIIWVPTVVYYYLNHSS